MTLRSATIALHDGGQTVVCLRFKIGETPIPLVACRARGERGAAMLAEAVQLGLLIAEDAELVKGLFRVQPGQAIPEPFFRPTAQAFARAGGVAA
jgi:type III secretion protein U